MLTRERLQEALSYDSETGNFRWLKCHSGVSFGGVAGTICNGYVVIRIDGHGYAAHRLAWMYVHGSMPVGQIDHINRVKADNRIANLRDVSGFQNSWNKFQAQSNSSTGFRGVYKRRMPSGAYSYRAKIRANGREIILGHFKSPEEASAAYLKAKNELHKI